VYYAPPGAEKTTAASKELFIGFDTDWIGTGITWKVLTLLFREEVPIITNQESIFFGSGIKVVGIVKKRIRDRLDRKERIKAVHKSHWKNFIPEEVHDRTFMSDCLLNVQCSTANDDKLCFKPNAILQKYVKCHVKYVQSKKVALLKTNGGIRAEVVLLRC
jgi:hypothetical protein